LDARVLFAWRNATCRSRSEHSWLLKLDAVASFAYVHETVSPNDYKSTEQTSWLKADKVKEIVEHLQRPDPHSVG
jgi:hypothetical protein